MFNSMAERPTADPNKKTNLLMSRNKKPRDLTPVDFLWGADACSATGVFEPFRCLPVAFLLETAPFFGLRR